METGDGDYYFESLSWLGEQDSVDFLKWDWQIWAKWKK